MDPDARVIDWDAVRADLGPAAGGADEAGRVSAADGINAAAMLGSITAGKKMDAQ